MIARFSESALEQVNARLAEAYRTQRYDEAYESLREFDPSRFAGHPELPLFFLLALQHTLAATGQIESALAVYREAKRYVAAEKLFSVAYPLCFEAGWLEEVHRLEVALPLAARTPEERFATGCVALARDYYPEGFRLYEARLALREAATVINPALRSLPVWPGGSLTGRRLLLSHEQGLGDALMMARFLPTLLDRARAVAIEVPATLHALLSANFPRLDVFEQRHGAVPTGLSFDDALPLMSLPHRLALTAHTVPARAGYLRAPSEHRAYWRERIAAYARPGALRIGLAWAGHPGQRADRRRSLPWPLLAPWLATQAEVDFFVLQTHDAAHGQPPLIDLSEELVTLADTAALIEELDLVIAVDTSVIHLAGALGKPAWLLLPYRYEWRWGLQGERNAWYESVRVLRQRRPGDWPELLKRLANEFADWKKTTPRSCGC